MLQSAPVVLNRFQNSAYRIVGRLADAATANASATRNAMFWLRARMPAAMAMTPITTAVMRATPTSASGLVSPRLMTLAYTSWANDADAVIVRPATTARIVANAIAEMIPSMISPPSSYARSGAAELVPPGAVEIRCAPPVTRADAP